MIDSKTVSVPFNIPNDVMTLVRSLRSDGLEQGRDYDFKINSNKAIFTFYKDISPRITLYLLTL